MVVEKRQLAKKGKEVVQELVAEQIPTYVECHSLRNGIAATNARETALLSQLESVKRYIRREKDKMRNLMRGGGQLLNMYRVYWIQL